MLLLDYSGAMRSVSSFFVDANTLRGVLPESGIRAMRAVMYFQIDRNSFTGTLSDGFRAFMAVE
eukprot:6096032-Amphidinium_carterae.1